MSHVFICYHHNDGDFAENLRSKIEAAGISTWMDDRLRAGEDWRVEIDKAIKEDAVALIVVVTPEAKASEYVTYEWACAWGAGLKVIPVLLKHTGLHPRLEALQYLDFTDRPRRPWERLIEELQKVTGTPARRASRLTNAPPIIERAIDALDSLDQGDRDVAIKNLGSMNHPAAREALAGAVKHPIRDVRIQAALALGPFEDPRATPALIEALGGDGRQIEAATRGLTKIGTPAIPELIDALSDNSQIVREAIVKSLDNMNHPAAREALAGAVKHPIRDVRIQAALALGPFEDRRATPALIEALGGDGRQVEAATRGLAKLVLKLSLSWLMRWVITVKVRERLLLSYW